MQRTHTSYASDSESLQADVMRFMAIIAFCLIAILALVRNTDEVPAEPSAAAPEPVTTAQIPDPITAEADAPEPVAKEAESEPEPEPEPEPASSITPETAPIETPAEPAPSEPVPQVAEAVATPLPKPLPAPAPAPAPEPVTDTVAGPASDAESPAGEDEGLTLRFASDGDFLRLIARGDIRVYAFQDSDVLALSESYRFLDTTAPGQVYELLPPSIPGLIVDALRQARSDTAGYRWGIALPGRISHQIEQHLNRVSRGELVIDRYGDVHHVAAS